MIPQKLLVPISILVVNGVRYKYKIGFQLPLLAGINTVQVLGKRMKLNLLSVSGGASGSTPNGQNLFRLPEDIGTPRDNTRSGGGGYPGNVDNKDIILVPGKQYRAVVGNGGRRTNVADGWYINFPGGITQFINVTDSITLVNLAGGAGHTGGVSTYEQGVSYSGMFGSTGGGTGDSGGGPPNPGLSGGSGGSTSPLFGGANSAGAYGSGGYPPGGIGYYGQGDGNAEGGAPGYGSGGGSSGYGILFLNVRYGGGGGGGGDAPTAPEYSYGGKGGSGVIGITMK